MPWIFNLFIFIVVGVHIHILRIILFMFCKALLFDYRVILSLAFSEGKLLFFEWNLSLDGFYSSADVFFFLNAIEKLNIELIDSPLLVNLLENAYNELC